MSVVVGQIMHAAIITQLLLDMSAQPGSPSRLPIHSLQNSFVQSINPQFSPSAQPYNFHDRSMSPPSPLQNQYHPARQEPVLSANLNLADKPSFARNFRGRLYGADVSEDEAKQLKQQKYRQQLLFQAEEDRRRKKEIKDREDAEDLKRELQFNANKAIQAQKKAMKKEEPSYFMMRTANGGLSKQNNMANSRTQVTQQDNYMESLEKKGIHAAQLSKKDNLKRTLYEHPKIMKRGGYHNQSSLDPKISNPQQNGESPQPPSPKVERKRLSQSMKPRRQQFEAELRYEQQRIHQILMFQQHMLKKLDYFKKDVIVASRSLHLDEQLDKVRLRLRAKPLNMQKIHHMNARQGIDNIMENTSFYHLPLISPRNKVYEGSREVKKRKQNGKQFQQLNSQDSSFNQPEQKQVVKLQDKRKVVFNDKNINFTGLQNEQVQQPS